MYCDLHIAYYNFYYVLLRILNTKTMRTHYITYVKKNIESTHRKGTPVAFLLHILKYLGQRIGRSGGAHIPLFLMTKFASLVLLHNNSP